ncbi:MAG: protein-glutamate O-methyltransferase CheR [Gammaproteobacteria bacterium]
MQETQAASDPGLAVVAIEDREFQLFQSLMSDEAGVSLAISKKPLVRGRLAGRLKVCGCRSYGAYYELVRQDGRERQLAVDLLTTNETYFFREPRHFQWLREEVLRGSREERQFRVWSAACSSGEEAYSLAMLLDDALGRRPWEVLGTDINSRVLAQARRGLYPLVRTDHMPPGYLKRYCLKGIGDYAGQFLVERGLRSKVSFVQANLNTDLPRLGMFDAVFLRNVMIYFSAQTKAQVVQRVLEVLRPGGYLCVGHSESLNGIATGLQALRPSIYRKPL